MIKTGKMSYAVTLASVALLLALLLLQAAPVEADSGWIIETVDSSGTVGYWTSLALDSNSHPHISYYDRDNRYLKYASHNGISWNLQTVDYAGLYTESNTSLALDDNDYPHISYYYAPNGDPYYASWNGTAWNPQTVHVNGGGTFNSLALDSNGYPHISYLNRDLPVALQYASWNGTAWNLQVIESSAGASNSLALDSNGYPHISYCSSDEVKYASWTGTTWNIQTVDSGGTVSFYTSLALDGNGYPHISFYDQTNDDFKYARWNGTAWNIQIVDSDKWVGLYSSLALDSNGYPHISYYDDLNHDMKYARWNGVNWNLQIVDSAENVGRWTSLALDGNGCPHISYYDSTNGDLKYARYVPQTVNVATAIGTGIANFSTSNGGFQNVAAVAQEGCGCSGAPCTFPHGLFSFTIIGLNPGETVTITITLPSAMPAGSQYWKCINGNWIDCTSLLGSNNGDNTITLTITDGGLGDADGVANGTIVDPGGPGIGSIPSQSVEGASSGEASSTTISSPNLNIAYLAVNPSQTVTNKPVTITANVVNEGGMTGSTRVALKINGQVEQTKLVTVGSGGSRPVKFTVTRGEPGTYSIIMGSQSASFMVTEDTSGTSADGGVIAIMLIVLLAAAVVLVLAVSLGRRPA